MILSNEFPKFALMFLLLHPLLVEISFGQSANSQTSDVGDMLNVMAESFKNKIKDDFSAVAQFDIKDKNESWHVIVEKGQKVTVARGAHEGALCFFFTTADTLRLIYEGKMTAATAASKAKGSDQAPLDLKLAEEPEFTPEVRTQLYTFLYHFFNPSFPERILLGEEHSRLVHGGHVIALYYNPGFRSAWYLLKKGEKLNEPGDTNPFPQAFIFLGGEGFAKIGDKTIKVRKGESYYIPPDSDHVVWTESEQPLILIWLAWGEGA